MTNQNKKIRGGIIIIRFDKWRFEILAARTIWHGIGHLMNSACNYCIVTLVMRRVLKGGELLFGGDLRIGSSHIIHNSLWHAGLMEYYKQKDII